MNSTMVSIDPRQLWNQALGELELQMTRATFDTWLRNTQGIDISDGKLHVAVLNTYAVEWLNNRLASVVARTVNRLAGQEIPIEYIVQEPGAPAIAAAKPTTAPSQPTPEQPDDTAETLRRLLEQITDPAAREVIEGQIARLAGGAGAAPEQPTYSWIQKYGGIDPKTWGYTQVANYAYKFWQPVMNRQIRATFSVYLVVRSAYKSADGEWTTPKLWAIEELARAAGCGRQSITGVSRRCAEDAQGAVLVHPEDLDGNQAEKAVWMAYRPGALDVLHDYGLATVDIRGSGRHTTYWISVKVSLPLLSPGQAATLPASLQAEHSKFLEEHDIPAEDWKMVV